MQLGVTEPLLAMSHVDTQASLGGGSGSVWWAEPVKLPHRTGLRKPLPPPSELYVSVTLSSSLQCQSHIIWSGGRCRDFSIPTLWRLEQSGAPQTPVKSGVKSHESHTCLGLPCDRYAEEKCPRNQIFSEKPLCLGADENVNSILLAEQCFEISMKSSLVLLL